MHLDELWQKYNDNGTAINGDGASADAFKDHPDFIMGNAHVWLWKRDINGVHVLLQQRSLTKTSKPGWFHISAGGHININETPLDAAVRETYEELGLKLNKQSLHYVASTRIIGRAPNDIAHVFLYKLNGNEAFTYNDGEAESFDWVLLTRFKDITTDPIANKLINQGSLYFGTLLAAIEYVADGENHLR